ncbi:MAG: hypothetical protein ACC707_05285, partial [Thiohalomonadales bacterium]
MFMLRIIIIQLALSMVFCSGYVMAAGGQENEKTKSQKDAIYYEISDIVLDCKEKENKKDPICGTSASESATTADTGNSNGEICNDEECPTLTLTIDGTKHRFSYPTREIEKQIQIYLKKKYAKWTDVIKVDIKNSKLNVFGTCNEFHFTDLSYEHENLLRDILAEGFQNTHYKQQPPKELSENLLDLKVKSTTLPGETANKSVGEVDINH